MTNIVEELIQNQINDCNLDQTGGGNPAVILNYTKTDNSLEKAMETNCVLDDKQEMKHPIRDINFPQKLTGYLALQSTDFEFIGPDRQAVQITDTSDYLRIARIVKETNVSNYKGACIPIQSGLNHEAWEFHLLGYPDKRLLQYIKFGFPLSLRHADKLHNTNVTNHPSATLHPRAVEEYLLSEKAKGAILGPFKHIQEEGFHCSPLLTRPKDTDKRRVILNLSHPQGCSVNDFVDRDKFDGSEFALKLPTIENIAEDIRNTHDDPVMIKVDVARAFRNLRVDPADSLKFGIKWENVYYLDLAIAFGWVHGTSAFQLCSDAIAFIMKKHNIALHVYIDDYIAVIPRDRAQDAFQRLCDVLTELGLPMNQEKLTGPTKRMTCLGIHIDIDTNTMSITPEKIESIYTECKSVSSKIYLSKKAFQSLTGKLLYIQKCVKPGRIFLNRILATFRDNPSRKRIYLNDEFRADLNWFLTFLPVFNGITYIKKGDVDDKQSLYLDACLTGMGAVWRDRVYATPILDIPNFDLKIVHLEMFNIIIALRIWATHWRHSRIKVFCDNLSVVQVVRSSKTRDRFLALCLRNLWLITACHDIDLCIEHIPGCRNNIADTLSRLYSNKPVNEAILSEINNRYIWEEVKNTYFKLDLHL